jgi:hypothetical protein
MQASKNEYMEYRAGQVRAYERRIANMISRVCRVRKDLGDIRDERESNLKE